MTATRKYSYARCRVLALLVAALGLLWLSAPVAANTGPSSRTTPTGASQKSSELKTVRFHSDALGEPASYVVYLPPGYTKRHRGGYPVIYALHGLAGQAAHWFQGGRGDLKRSLDTLIDTGQIEAVVVVAPEGASAYWTNHVATASGPGPKHGDAVIDVIDDAEQRYNIRTRGRPRAIVGVSMGGHGAMSQGLMRPQDFAAVVSLGGALFETAPTHRGIYKRVWGQTTDLNHWERTSPIALISAATKASASRWPALYLLCGDHDEYGFLQHALNAHQLLVQREIVHELRVVDGGHTWTPWAQSNADWLKFIDQQW